MSMERAWGSRLELLVREAEAALTGQGTWHWTLDIWIWSSSFWDSLAAGWRMQST